MRKVADKWRSDVEGIQLAAFTWIMHLSFWPGASHTNNCTLSDFQNATISEVWLARSKMSRTAPVNCGRPSVWRRAHFALLLIWFRFNCFYSSVHGENRSRSNSACFAPPPFLSPALLDHRRVFLCVFVCCQTFCLGFWTVSCAFSEAFASPWALSWSSLHSACLLFAELLFVDVLTTASQINDSVIGCACAAELPARWASHGHRLETRASSCCVYGVSWGVTQSCCIFSLSV